MKEFEARLNDGQIPCRISATTGAISKHAISWDVSRPGVRGNPYNVDGLTGWDSGVPAMGSPPDRGRSALKRLSSAARDLKNRFDESRVFNGFSQKRLET